MSAGETIGRVAFKQPDNRKHTTPGQCARVVALSTAVFLLLATVFHQSTVFYNR